MTTERNRQDRWDQLREDLSHSERTVVLTGSGVSASCGLHTYRSPGSPWPRLARMQTADRFREHLDTLWPVWDTVRRVAAAADPSPAHRALADLQRRAIARGANFTIITQNVDGLHDKAGATTVEVHGNLHQGICENCSTTTALADARFTGALPVCSRCDWVLRPNMVLFGERPHCPDLIETALRDADIVLVVGTSGTVHPVAGLPRFARAHGALVVLINAEAWQDMSPFAGGFGGDADELIPDLLR